MATTRVSASISRHGSSARETVADHWPKLSDSGSVEARAAGTNTSESESSTWATAPPMYTDGLSTLAGRRRNR